MFKFFYNDCFILSLKKYLKLGYIKTNIEDSILIHGQTNYQHKVYKDSYIIQSANLKDINKILLIMDNTSNSLLQEKVFKYREKIKVAKVKITMSKKTFRFINFHKNNYLKKIEFFSNNNDILIEVNFNNCGIIKNIKKQDEVIYQYAELNL